MPQSTSASGDFTDRFSTHLSAKEAAENALRGWLEALFTDIAALAADVHPAGDPTLVAFDAHVRHDSEEHHHWREELLSATVYNTAGQTVFTISDPAWGAVTSLWTELRTAIETAYSGAHVSPVGTGLVVDPAAQALFAWGPYYCPDVGNDPESLFDLKTRFANPFEALLTGTDESLDAAEERLLRLMSDYEVPCPTRPAHAAGDCETYDPHTHDGD